MFKQLTFLFSFFYVFSLCAITCNPYSLPTYKSGYVAFTIVNESGAVATSDLYITIVGTNPANLNSCIVELSAGMDGQWVGELIDATQFLFANHPSPSTPYSYQVSLIPTQNGQPVIYLPPISNATMYVSIGYGLGLNVSTGAPITIQPPQQFTTADPNYYHLYDNSIFFTIADELTIQSQYTNAFGLPVSSIISINGGTSVQYSGIITERSTLFSDYTTAVSSISNANSQAQWEKLPVSFTSASGGGATQLRLASTLSAMSFSTSPFDTSYLSNSGQYGANWTQTVFETGSPQIFFDVSGLTNSSLTYTYYQFTGVSGGNLVFIPGIGCSSSCTDVYIPYPIASSLPFLNAASSGASSFNATGDSLATPLICSYLSAGFVTGLFPVTTSKSSLFGTGNLAIANKNGQFYQPNSAFPGTGPWYDLYAATLHNAARGSSYFNFQADPVDANLGFFAPIVVRNNSSSQPAIFVVLNDLGSTIVPNFTDSTTYDITVAPTPSAISYTITYNGMTEGPYTSAMGFSNVEVPFTLEITYQTNTYSGQTFTTQIWLNETNDYSVVFPQPPGTIGVTSGASWNIAVPASP